jgi:hypothetical protein
MPLHKKSNRGGFIGGVHRGAHPCWPWSTGVQGGAKKSNSEIWHNFQGFSFFEVKLELTIQCPYIAENGISRVLNFQNFLGAHPWTP